MIVTGPVPRGAAPALGKGSAHIEMFKSTPSAPDLCITAPNISADTRPLIILYPTHQPPLAIIISQLLTNGYMFSLTKVLGRYPLVLRGAARGRPAGSTTCCMRAGRQPRPAVALRPPSATARSASLRSTVATVSVTARPTERPCLPSAICCRTRSGRSHTILRPTPRLLRWPAARLPLRPWPWLVGVGWGGGWWVSAWPAARLPLRP